MRGEVKKPKASPTASLSFLISADFSPTQQDLDGLLNVLLAMTEAYEK